MQSMPPFLQTARVLTFDCYGTLVDWETGLLKNLREGIAWREPPADDQLLAWYAQVEEAAETGPFRKYKDVLRAALAGVARWGGAEVVDPEAIVKGLPSWPVFDDTADALRTLKGKYKLCVVSNVDRDLFKQTNRAIGAEFDEVVTADQVESYKPRPNHFWEAMRRLDATPRDIVHVAQSLFHDHVPAKALGIRTVWVDRRRGRKGGAVPPSDASPDLTVQSLRELADMISGGA
jgi:2-haloacid dehalogenase